ncbi:MAG: hypothetical protein M0C28_36915 [Candidatus Moduliflexus flocculans]|nr:hypothetical protein [Candidatus Moduliflexus flocculans]
MKRLVIFAAALGAVIVMAGAASALDGDPARRQPACRRAQLRGRQRRRHLRQLHRDGPGPGEEGAQGHGRQRPGQRHRQPRRGSAGRFRLRSGRRQRQLHRDGPQGPGPGPPWRPQLTPTPSRGEGPGARPRGLPLAASVLALATTGALPPPSAAQVSVGAALVPAFESLSPEGAARESRATIDGGLDAEALFASERGRVFYTLDAGTYSTPGDWSFLQHDAGLTWRIGDTAGPHAFLGISGTLRRNGDAWAAADYGAVGAKANLAWSPRAGLTLRAGVRVDAQAVRRHPRPRPGGGPRASLPSSPTCPRAPA